MTGRLIKALQNDWNVVPLFGMSCTAEKFSLIFSLIGITFGKFRRDSIRRIHWKSRPISTIWHVITLYKTHFYQFESCTAHQRKASKS